MSREIIHLEKIVKRFYIGQPNELEILHGIDLSVYEGEFASIIGASGSGKSTLMNIIGALDKPTEGEYTLDGVDIIKAKDTELSAIRNQKIGFVFQTYNLIARTTALKNVEMPMLYKGIGRKERRERAMELLEMVGMKERMSHTPDELSGGQKQRVAIARAMACDPAIILADEPTGALDTKTGHTVMDIFHQLNEEQGKTIVLITHAPELAEETGRIITLSDGNIMGIRLNEHPVIKRPENEKSDDEIRKEQIAALVADEDADKDANEDVIENITDELEDAEKIDEFEDDDIAENLADEVTAILDDEASDE